MDQASTNADAVDWWRRLGIACVYAVWHDARDCWIYDDRALADLWWDRYEKFEIGGLENVPRPAGTLKVAPRVRARILALTRCSPPVESGLSHWSSREMAKYLKRHEGIVVSHDFIADLWRANDLQRPLSPLSPTSPLHQLFSCA
ncbi:helix-turn-helix domain-containing protein [Frankia sp. Cas3]|uniref:helix-turn-helix domain-containing protein n=1 Tax=Frankia sp. Cas3 TaxID=3073926 RepID=UPI002AD3CDAC|nr:helix-turn-helix domain-containing protein [Frankia sp. Cas3]